MRERERGPFNSNINPSVWATTDNLLHTEASKTNAAIVLTNVVIVLIGAAIILTDMAIVLIDAVIILTGVAIVLHVMTKILDLSGKEMRLTKQDE